ncbi:oncostatin-M [Ascaphus truei]|uniref:oncostatin-M n=1 Tax=Ascaphus truei TaxID=8439 RepID=UPI003F5A70D7
MVGSFKNGASLLGVTYGLILCTFTVTLSVSQCPGCGPEVLKQSKNKAHEMMNQAKTLFRTYVSEQGFQPYINLCDESVGWFPKPNITLLPRTAMLQEIYLTLQRLDRTFAVLMEQEKALELDSNLLSELTEAHTSITALRSNIHCALCPHKLPDTSSLPQIPKVTDFFQQKTEGCQVLKAYVDFMRQVETGLGKLTKKRGKKRSKKTTNF